MRPNCPISTTIRVALVATLNVLSGCGMSAGSDATTVRDVAGTPDTGVPDAGVAGPSDAGASDEPEGGTPTPLDDAGTTEPAPEDDQYVGATGYQAGSGDDELAGGGGCTGPSTPLRLTVPWLPQVPPGNWPRFKGDSASTHNCGPACFAMADRYLSAVPADESVIRAIDDWMASRYWSGDVAGYNGHDTTKDQLAALARDYGGYGGATSFSGIGCGELAAELADGRPVIVAVDTQGGNDAPSTTMKPSSFGHWVLVTGMDASYVYLDDPGRSAPINGCGATQAAQCQGRRFTLASFYALWSKHGRSGVYVRSDGGCPENFCSQQGHGSGQWCVDGHTLATCSASGACIHETDATCPSGCDANAQPNACIACGGPCNTPPDACHEPNGTCNAGACNYPPKPAGTACDDGDACTSGDRCDGAGHCAGSGACESCNGVDDDGNGVVDDPASCWKTVYRFVSSSGARCWGLDDVTPPAQCSGYAREREAFLVHATSVPGTFPLVECGRGTDHILTSGNSGDVTLLQNGGYDCSVLLGYAYPLGAAPKSPWPYTCPLWRYSWSINGSGAHLFTTGPDNTAGMSCESPARASVPTNVPCFAGTPQGC